MNPRLRGIGMILLMAAAYFLSGRLGLLLAIPPGYATAVWPASGIALAGVLIAGWRISPGVWLGSFLINIGTSLDTSHVAAMVQSAQVPAIVALGATAQALVGAALIRRITGYQNILTMEARVILLLLLGGPLACLINASVGVGTLWYVGAVPIDSALFNWWTWWIGDAIGVLVFAPIVLVWTVRPYRIWYRRQLSIAGPLLLMFSLTVVIFFNISEREQIRFRAEFETAGRDIAHQLQTELGRYEIGLSATAGFFSGWNGQRDSFEQYAKLLLSQLPHVYAVGWDKLVLDSERDAYEKRMRAAGHANFEISELDSQGRLVRAGRRAYYVPITDILYNGPASHSIGYDIASEAKRLVAMEKAIRTGKATASDRISIIGDPDRAEGVLLLQPVYQPPGKHVTGFAVLVLRTNGIIQNIVDSAHRKSFHLKLMDQSEPARQELLYQSPQALKHDPSNITYSIPMQVAQRDWLLELTLPASYLVAHKSWQAWVVLAVGLLLTALLGILLLIIIGRTSRIEEVVSERTSALQESERRFRNLLESAPDALIIIRQDGSIDLVNSMAEKLFGYSKSELLGQPIEILVPHRYRPQHHQHRSGFFKSPHVRPMGEGLDLYGLKKDGTEFPIEVSLSPLRSGNRNTVTATIRDITERKESESYVRHLAHHDTLTQLPNRSLMHERLKVAMEQARSSHESLCLMMVDLDHFKRVNDTLGHHVGDELLQAIVERLLACVRPGDTVARMGGDEFVVLLPGLRDPQVAATIAASIQEQIARPVNVGGRELVVTSSIGLTLYPQDGPDSATLLKNADTAMYQAKEKGRNSYQWFKPYMLQAAEEQLNIENDLRRALVRGEFELYYQPVVQISTGTCIGYEALLRWRHPQRGLISPESFVGLAESSGLIVPIGEWTLRTACREIRMLQQRHGKPLFVAVNLSPRQFRQSDIRQLVQQALNDSGLDAQQLTLEITETVLVENPKETAHTLTELRKSGVRIALDDFGTGYSSLSYITRYPIDKIKIDRSFVHDIGQDPSDTAIINAILAMSHSLGIQVTAEGIETVEQLEHLRQHDCDEAQGFYFGEAKPVDIA